MRTTQARMFTQLFQVSIRCSMLPTLEGNFEHPIFPWINWLILQWEHNLVPNYKLWNRTPLLDKTKPSNVWNCTQQKGCNFKCSKLPSLTVFVFYLSMGSLFWFNNKISDMKTARNIKTYDFSTIYINLQLYVSNVSDLPLPNVCKYV